MTGSLITIYQEVNLQIYKLKSKIFIQLDFQSNSMFFFQKLSTELKMLPAIVRCVYLFTAIVHLRGKIKFLVFFHRIEN